MRASIKALFVLRMTGPPAVMKQTTRSIFFHSRAEPNHSHGYHCMMTSLFQAVQALPNPTGMKTYLFSQ